MTDSRYNTIASKDWWWGATASRVGTNEAMHETAETKEQLDVKLFGCAYGAKRWTVVYYRFPMETKTS
jgi:hypothetical protein